MSSARFDVRHITTYAFDLPVFLEPHVVRLTPATDAGQRLVRFGVEVHPKPAGIKEILDLQGNSTLILWFEGLVSELQVSTTAQVETFRSNPFGYLSFHEPRLPVRYPMDLMSVAGPYLSEPNDASVIAFGQFVAQAAGDSPEAFLPSLAAEIRDHCCLIVREEGVPRSAGETLALAEGSCRDLAVLFIDVCRSMGFAARFVSGYHAVLGEGEQDLHAWAEAYIDGGGWLGFDPTTGLAVGNHHIVVARAATPLNAAPIAGKFRGSAVARLASSVSIRAPGDGQDL